MLSHKDRGSTLMEEKRIYSFSQHMETSQQYLETMWHFPACTGGAKEVSSNHCHWEHRWATLRSWKQTILTSKFVQQHPSETQLAWQAFVVNAYHNPFARIPLFTITNFPIFPAFLNGLEFVMNCSDNIWPCLCLSLAKHWTISSGNWTRRATFNLPAIHGQYNTDL